LKDKNRKYMKLIKEWFVFIKKCIYLTKEQKQPSNKNVRFFVVEKSDY